MFKPYHVFWMLLCLLGHAPQILAAEHASSLPNTESDRQSPVAALIQIDGMIEQGRAAYLQREPRCSSGGWCHHGDYGNHLIWW